MERTQAFCSVNNSKIFSLNKKLNNPTFCALDDFFFFFFAVGFGAEKNVMLNICQFTNKILSPPPFCIEEI